MLKRFTATKSAKWVRAAEKFLEQFPLVAPDAPFPVNLGVYRCMCRYGTFVINKPCGITSAWLYGRVVDTSKFPVGYRGDPGWPAEVSGKYNLCAGDDPEQWEEQLRYHFAKIEARPPTEADLAYWVIEDAALKKKSDERDVGIREFERLQQDATSMKNPHFLCCRGRAVILDIPAGFSTDDWSGLYDRFRLAAFRGRPDPDEFIHCHQIYPERRFENVAWHEELAGSSGMAFELFPAGPHLPVDTTKCAGMLKSSRDVVCIRIIQVTEWIHYFPATLPKTKLTTV